MKEIVHSFSEMFQGRELTAIMISKGRMMHYFTDGTILVTNKKDPIRLMRGRKIIKELRGKSEGKQDEIKRC